MKQQLADFILIDLQQFIKEDDALLQTATDQAIDFMLQEIGHLNPVIRDETIHAAFCKLILKNGATNEQCMRMTEVCIDSKHLFYEIQDQKNLTAVFTRSFSALLLALLLYQDQQTPFLENELAQQAICASIKYMQLEWDTRGYVLEYGWAHAVAHGSDLLAQAVSHPAFQQVCSETAILTILQNYILTEAPFIDEEHERMLPVLDALLEKGLSKTTMLAWLSQLHSYQSDQDLKTYRIQWNVKQFMHAFYFHLQQEDDYADIWVWILSRYSAS